MNTLVRVKRKRNEPSIDAFVVNSLNEIKVFSLIESLPVEDFKVKKLKHEKPQVPFVHSQSSLLKSESNKYVLNKSFKQDNFKILEVAKSDIDDMVNNLNISKEVDENEYFYDLYYDSGLALTSENVASFDYVFEEYNESSSDFDSEDSNAEDYYQNDYPDSDSYCSSENYYSRSLDGSFSELSDPFNGDDSDQSHYPY
jgi:hypothetical protein